MRIMLFKCISYMNIFRWLCTYSRPQFEETSCCLIFPVAAVLQRSEMISLRVRPETMSQGLRSCMVLHFITSMKSLFKDLFLKREDSWPKCVMRLCEARSLPSMSDKDDEAILM